MNFRGVFLGCKHAVIQFKEQGDGGVILNTGSVAGLVGWGGTVYGATKGAVHQLTRAVAVEGAPFGIRANAICPAGMPYTSFMAAGGMARLGCDLEAVAAHTGSMHPLGRPITAEDCAEAAVYLVLRPVVQRHGSPPSDRRRIRRPMTRHRGALGPRAGPRSSSTWRVTFRAGTAATTTPIPTRSGAVSGSRRRCTREPSTSSSGVDEDLLFHGLPYPDRPHFSAFTYEACDAVYRNPELFASSAEAVDLEDGEPGPTNSMLSMGGAQHRRYRALVQPSFVPAKAQWWIENWIEETVHAPDRQLRERRPGGAQCRVLRRHSGADDHRELRGPGRAGPRRPGGSERNPNEIIEMISPIVAARREQPAGRPHQRPRRSRDQRRGRDAPTASPTPRSIPSPCSCSLPGSGTTWKQMGITLAALLQRPEVLEAVREDRSLLRPAIEESLRWMPTDPMFSRWVTEDIDFFGVHLPKGAVLHICLGAANRDPARWEHPDEYDIFRPSKPTLAFGSGPHICLGMHVARAEMTVGHRRPARPAPQPAARPRRRTAHVHRFLRAGSHRHPRPLRLTRWRSRSERSLITDHPTSPCWAEHVRRYQETDGEVGYLWNGVPTLLLTTTGRRSGQPAHDPAHLRPQR